MNKLWRIFVLSPSLILLLAFLSILTVSTSAEAKLRMCNKTSEKVSIAIGYRKNSDWVSEGWWNLEPDSCEVLKSNALNSRYYYVYATDFVEGGVWSGEGLMCVQDREFTIYGVRDCVARGYQRRGFFEVDTRQLKSWTIQLTDSVGGVGKIGVGGR